MRVKLYIMQQDAVKLFKDTGKPRCTCMPYFTFSCVVLIDYNTMLNNTDEYIKTEGCIYFK